jgi:hypothetical protein
MHAPLLMANAGCPADKTSFPGAACAGALVDRFAQHCHRVDMDADSWRDALLAEQEKAPRAVTADSWWRV